MFNSFSTDTDDIFYRKFYEYADEFVKNHLPDGKSPSSRDSCTPIVDKCDRFIEPLIKELEAHICGVQSNSSELDPLRELQSRLDKLLPSGHQICGHIFSPHEPTYTCRDCAVDSLCVLCGDCFTNSVHATHNYKLYTSSGNGYCDCGDPEAWRSHPRCRLHSSKQSDDIDDPSSCGGSSQEPSTDHLRECLDALPTDVVQRSIEVLRPVINLASFCLIELVQEISCLELPNSSPPSITTTTGPSSTTDLDLELSDLDRSSMRWPPPLTHLPSASADDEIQSLRLRSLPRTSPFTQLSTSLDPLPIQVKRFTRTQLVKATKRFPLIFPPALLDESPSPDLAGQFVLLMHNDEVHNYDQVIRVLGDAREYSTREASDTAIVINRDGRSLLLRTNQQDRCVRLAIQIMTPSRSGQGPNPLWCSVEHALIYASQTLATSLLRWVSCRLVELVPALRPLICQACLGLFNGSQSPLPIHLPPINQCMQPQSLLSNFFHGHVFSWRSAQQELQRLVMTTILNDLFYRHVISYEYTRVAYQLKHCNLLVRLFQRLVDAVEANTIALPAFCQSTTGTPLNPAKPCIAIFSLLARDNDSAWQLTNAWFNTACNALLQEDQCSRTALHGEVDTSIKPRVFNWPSAYNREYHSNYRPFDRLFTCRRPLEYALTSLANLWQRSPRSSDSSWLPPESRLAFANFSRLFCRLLSYVQDMNSMIRQRGVHVDSEPEWFSGFSTVAALARLHNSVLQVASLDVELLRSILYEARKTFYQRVGVLDQRFIAKSPIPLVSNILGVDTEVSMYDLLLYRFSFIQPLPRLLASLFGLGLEMGCTMQELGLADRSYANLLLERPLQVMATIAQTNAKLWVRNGTVMENSVYNLYASRLRVDFLDRDLQLIQQVASVLRPDEFLVRLIHKFNLGAYLTLKSPTPQPGEICSTEMLLRLLLAIVSQRVRPSVGRFRAPAPSSDLPLLTPNKLEHDHGHLIYDLIHLLCLKPMTFKELVNNLVQQPVAATTVIDGDDLESADDPMTGDDDEGGEGLSIGQGHSMIGQKPNQALATLLPSLLIQLTTKSSVRDQTLFTLKPAFMKHRFNRFYFGYSDSNKNKAEQYVCSQLKKKRHVNNTQDDPSSQQQPLPPPPPLPIHRFQSQFASIAALLSCPTFVRMARNVLEIGLRHLSSSSPTAASTNNASRQQQQWSDSLFDLTLHLIGSALYEDQINGSQTGKYPFVEAVFVLPNEIETEDELSQLASTQFWLDPTTTSVVSGDRHLLMSSIRNNCLVNRLNQLKQLNACSDSVRELVSWTLNLWRRVTSERNQRLELDELIDPFSPTPATDDDDFKITATGKKSAPTVSPNTSKLQAARAKQAKLIQSMMSKQKQFIAGFDQQPSESAATSTVSGPSGGGGGQPCSDPVSSDNQAAQSNIDPSSTTMTNEVPAIALGPNRALGAAARSAFDSDPAIDKCKDGQGLVCGLCMEEHVEASDFVLPLHISSSNVLSSLPLYSDFLHGGREAVELNKAIANTNWTSNRPSTSRQLPLVQQQESVNMIERVTSYLRGVSSTCVAASSSSTNLANCLLDRLTQQPLASINDSLSSTSAESVSSRGSTNPATSSSISTSSATSVKKSKTSSARNWQHYRPLVPAHFNVLNNSIFMSPCSHVFHSSCVDKYLTVMHSLIESHQSQRVTLSIQTDFRCPLCKWNANARLPVTTIDNDRSRWFRNRLSHAELPANNVEERLQLYSISSRQSLDAWFSSMTNWLWSTSSPRATTTSTTNDPSPNNLRLVMPWVQLVHGQRQDKTYLDLMNPDNLVESAVSDWIECNANFLQQLKQRLSKLLAIDETAFDDNSLRIDRQPETTDGGEEAEVEPVSSPSRLRQVISAIQPLLRNIRRNFTGEPQPDVRLRSMRRLTAAPSATELANRRRRHSNTDGVKTTSNILLAELVDDMFERSRIAKTSSGRSGSSVWEPSKLWSTIQSACDDATKHQSYYHLSDDLINRCADFIIDRLQLPHLINSSNESESRQRRHTKLTFDAFNPTQYQRDLIGELLTSLLVCLHQSLARLVAVTTDSNAVDNSLDSDPIVSHFELPSKEVQLLRSCQVAATISTCIDKLGVELLSYVSVGWRSLRHSLAYTLVANENAIRLNNRSDSFFNGGLAQTRLIGLSHLINTSLEAHSRFAVVSTSTFGPSWWWSRLVKLDLAKTTGGEASDEEQNDELVCPGVYSRHLSDHVRQVAVSKDAELLWKLLIPSGLKQEQEPPVSSSCCDTATSSSSGKAHLTDPVEISLIWDVDISFLFISLLHLRPGLEFPPPHTRCQCQSKPDGDQSTSSTQVSLVPAPWTVCIFDASQPMCDHGRARFPIGDGHESNLVLLCYLACLVQTLVAWQPSSLDTSLEPSKLPELSPDCQESLGWNSLELVKVWSFARSLVGLPSVDQPADQPSHQLASYLRVHTLPFLRLAAFVIHCITKIDPPKGLTRPSAASSSGHPSTLVDEDGLDEHALLLTYLGLPTNPSPLLALLTPGGDGQAVDASAISHLVKQWCLAARRCSNPVQQALSSSPAVFQRLVDRFLPSRRRREDDPLALSSFTSPSPLDHQMPGLIRLPLEYTTLLYIALNFINSDSSSSSSLVTATSSRGQEHIDPCLCLVCGYVACTVCYKCINSTSTNHRDGDRDLEGPLFSSMLYQQHQAVDWGESPVDGSDLEEQEDDELALSRPLALHALIADAGSTMVDLPPSPPPASKSKPDRHQPEGKQGMLLHTRQCHAGYSLILRVQTSRVSLLYDRATRELDLPSPYRDQFGDVDPGLSLMNVDESGLIDSDSDYYNTVGDDDGFDRPIISPLSGQSHCEFPAGGHHRASTDLVDPSSSKPPRWKSKKLKIKSGSTGGGSTSSNRPKSLALTKRIAKSSATRNKEGEKQSHRNKQFSADEGDDRLVNDCTTLDNDGVLEVNRHGDQKASRLSKRLGNRSSKSKSSTTTTTSATTPVSGSDVIFESAISSVTAIPGGTSRKSSSKSAGSKKKYSSSNRSESDKVKKKTDLGSKTASKRGKGTKTPVLSTKVQPLLDKINRGQPLYNDDAGSTNSWSNDPVDSSTRSAANQQLPDVLAVGCLVKHFLRCLPDPLLTSRLTPDFNSLYSSDAADAVISNHAKLVQLIYHDMPVENRYLLAWLLQHLLHVVDCSSDNGASLNELCQAFASITRIDHRLLGALMSPNPYPGFPFNFDPTNFVDDQSLTPLSPASPSDRAGGHWLFPQPFHSLRPYQPPLSPSRLANFLTQQQQSPEDDSLAYCSRLGVELTRQESLLAHLRSELSRRGEGEHCQEDEELIWELQRLVTELKRRKRKAGSDPVNTLKSELAKCEAELDWLKEQLLVGNSGAGPPPVKPSPSCESSVATTGNSTDQMWELQRRITTIKRQLKRHKSSLPAPTLASSPQNNVLSGSIKQLTPADDDLLSFTFGRRIPTLAEIESGEERMDLTMRRVPNNEAVDDKSQGQTSKGVSDLTGQHQQSDSDKASSVCSSKKQHIQQQQSGEEGSPASSSQPPTNDNFSIAFDQKAMGSMIDPMTKGPIPSAPPLPTTDKSPPLDQDTAAWQPIQQPTVTTSNTDIELSPSNLQMSSSDKEQATLTMLDTRRSELEVIGMDLEARIRMEEDEISHTQNCFDQWLAKSDESNRRLFSTLRDQLFVNIDSPLSSLNNNTYLSDNQTLSDLTTVIPTVVTSSPGALSKDELDLIRELDRLNTDNQRLEACIQRLAGQINVERSRLAEVKRLVEQSLTAEAGGFTTKT